MKHRTDFFVCNRRQFVHIVLHNQLPPLLPLESRVPTVLTTTTARRRIRGTTDRANDHSQLVLSPISWQMSFPTCSTGTSARHVATSVSDQTNLPYLRTVTDTLFDRLINVANWPRDLSLLDHIAITHYIHNNTHPNAPPFSHSSPASSGSSCPAKRQRKTHHCPRSTSRSASPCIRLSLSHSSLLLVCSIHSS